MAARLRARRILPLLLTTSVGLGGIEGCTQPEPAAKPVWRDASFAPLTVAVAPALNFSGSTDFDPQRVADLMASELGHVEGTAVIPVSRVLAVLARQGRSEVESPEHALEVCRQLGADAILVFAVTEYDPYNPPIIGITAQLYGPVLDRGAAMSPYPGSGGASPSTMPAASQPSEPIRPLVSVQRVFNAAHDDVVQQVRRFAQDRRADGGPYGWRLYLVSQEHYLRFCCAAVLEELVGAGAMPAPNAGAGAAG